MKNKKGLFVCAIVLLVTLCFSAFMGCGAKKETIHGIAYTDYTDFDELTQLPEYNEELWRRNDTDVRLPDPFVLDNVEKNGKDGWYYVYGTSENFDCYRSRDLQNWESMGTVLRMPRELSGTGDFWAPEVVYDAGTYYLFFSCRPKAERANGIDTGDAEYLIMVAQSFSPTGPFDLIDFTDETSCGKGNMHDYNTDDYPQTYAKYAYLSPYEHYTAATQYDKGIPDKFEHYKMYTADRGGYICTIDPHPFVDANGNKYIYFNKVNPYGTMVGIPMKNNNWLTPDWENYTLLTRTYYYTVDDFDKAVREGDETIETVPYEQDSDNPVNEGVFLHYHNGKYYLLYSSNGFFDSTYCVAQAVADTPLGPFRKLKPEEGGVVLSSDLGGNTSVSGSGHNSLITVNGELYIVYHTHDDSTDPDIYRTRHVNIDKVNWVTIGEGENKLDVMYATPTTCIMPKIISDYRNVAKDAKLEVVSGKLNEGSSAAYLTDGLYSYYKNVNAGFVDRYIKETEITQTTTFAFGFDSAVDVRALMISDSKTPKNVFLKIPMIKLYGADGKIYGIKDLELNEKYYTVSEFDGSIRRVATGAAIYAEFDELKVKKIEITVECPANAIAGISEIEILGKGGNL
ncbi:MAG: hypothetical protein DBY36_07170 [Clostridiales bacterium]|nr:MAG: hypothetical protein DBY36_07170 [Clostridiales bacterium]